MSDAATPTPENQMADENHSFSPMSRKAKICVTICLTSFCVLASMTLGLPELIAQIPAYIYANWQPILASPMIFIVLVPLAWALEVHPAATMKIGCLSFLCASPLAWYLIATYTTNDGSHPVSVNLVVGLVTTALLFSLCAASHFGTAWGNSKTERFYRAAFLSSAAALVVAIFPTASAYTTDRFAERNAAKAAFQKMHPGENSVPTTDLEVSGKKFSCSIDDGMARCSLGQ